MADPQLLRAVYIFPSTR